MQHHMLLREEERNYRFTVQDAIDVLPKNAGFGDDDFAEIRVGGIPLPSGEVVGLTNLVFGSHALGITLVVSLATSARFKAKCRAEADARTCSIFKLDEAKVGSDGTVRLSDGTFLRAVEVIPARLPINPSELDWRILRLVISIIGAEGRCYRSLREHAKPRCSDLPEDIVPEISRIDCTALKGHQLPSLKELLWQITKRDPTLKTLSRETVSKALRTFGMRLPVNRPRKGSRFSKPQFKAL